MQVVGLQYTFQLAIGMGYEELTRMRDEVALAFICVGFSTLGGHQQ